jgi:hypothetical protein
MGANVFSRLQTQRDLIRLSTQVTGSPLDSGRQAQTPRNSLTRKRSLVQIQYGPPGISCSWPYQVALRGPTTGPTVRAKDMPRSQAHGHRRGRAQAHIWPHRHAWERFMRPVALCGPTARADPTDSSKRNFPSDHAGSRKPLDALSSPRAGAAAHLRRRTRKRFCCLVVRFKAEISPSTVCLLGARLARTVRSAR